MKNWQSAAVVALVLVAPAGAQPPELDLSRQQQAIEDLSFMFGEWQGEATMRRGPDQHTSRMVETIKPSLDGTLLEIHGLGTEAGDDGQARVTHRALGLVWFDEVADHYRMKTFVPGRTADAHFERTNGGMRWGFETPGGRVRYTATFSDDSWTEIGEFSPDGETWMPFLEMTLKRVEG